MKAAEDSLKDEMLKITAVNKAMYENVKTSLGEVGLKLQALEESSESEDDFRFKNSTLSSSENDDNCLKLNADGTLSNIDLDLVNHRPKVPKKVRLENSLLMSMGMDDLVYPKVLLKLINCEPMNRLVTRKYYRDFINPLGYGESFIRDLKKRKGEVYNTIRIDRRSHC